MGSCCFVKVGIIQECASRMAMRRPVTLPWLTRTCQTKITDLEESGWQVFFRGEKFTGSRTWCWRWLITSGFLSRSSGNKRPHAPEVVEKAMTEWLHFLREEILYPKKSSPAGATDGATALIADINKAISESIHVPQPPPFQILCLLSCCCFPLFDKISKIYEPLQILKTQFHQPDTGVQGRASHS